MSCSILWLRKDIFNLMKDGLYIPSRTGIFNIYTKEFNEFKEKYKNKIGIYFIHSDELLFYIGSSKKIGQRSKDSFEERIGFDVSKQYYLSIILTNTYEDAYLFEGYCINKYKPTYNKAKMIKISSDVDIVDVLYRIKINIPPK